MKRLDSKKYFWDSTVIGEIANLHIGSRRRRGRNHFGLKICARSPGCSDWAQSRLMLPGWYGFGAAVKAWIAAHPADGLPLLQRDGARMAVL